jgi:hypothetical protein
MEKKEDTLDSLKQTLETLSLKHVDEDTPPKLFHYTDTGGLLGILDSQQLWATHSFYLNDATEINYTYELVEEKAQMFIKKLCLMQKDLRLVKKDLSQTMREMRSEVAARKARIGAGFGAGVAIGLLGRRMAGKFNALRRDSLRETQLEALAPYESVARVIDEALYQLDRAKLQLESWTPGSKG